MTSDGPRTGRPYATVTAFDNALRKKLAAAVTEQRTYQDVRKELAFDRVLARLTAAAPDLWLLKGGVALEYRLQASRATTDIDVSSLADLDAMSDALAKASALSLDDYFMMRVGERSKPVAELETYRFNISVLYENGRRFEELKLDIGFADPWLGEPQLLTARPLLEFARIAPSTVRAIPLEQHLAEKLHAYTRRYGGRESTRVKDLVDMVLLLQAAPINDATLSQTLISVFSARRTHAVPRVLSPPPASWSRVYARIARNLPIPADSDAAYEYVASALAGTLRAATEDMA